MTRHVVELFGVPRRVAGVTEVEVDLPDDGTLSDVVAALADSCPGLVGRVLASDGRTLVEPYVFNLNGRHFPAGVDVQLAAEDRILLMLSAAGG